MASTFTILGIDTSLRSTGYGVISAAGSTMKALDCGRIHNRPALARSECLRRIQAGLEDVIERHTPDAAAIEGIFYCKNVKTAMILGEARGAVISLCARMRVPVYEYSPRRVKQSVVGAGSASKQQIGAMIRTLLGLAEIPQEDAADALAIAISHLHAQSRIAGLDGGAKAI